MARGPGRPVPVSPATRHRRLVALRSFLRYCAREDWTPGDLGVTIDLPKLPCRLPKPLTDADVDRVTADLGAGFELDAAVRRHRALIAILLSTGARIPEALALKRADSHQEQVIVRGKGDIERTVVTARARCEVDVYLAARTDDCPALFASYSPGRTRRLSVRGAEAICDRLGASNDITKLHPTGSGTPPAPSSRTSSATPD